jgi:pyruvate formate lyase activating enzyme
MSDSTRGIVTDIQRFALHDGPGIRTTVFLKGCPLRCFWCHNPETWSHSPQIRYFTEKCTDCRICLEVCPQQPADASTIRPGVFPDKCTTCGTCIDNCSSGAREICGKEYTSGELLAELIKDKAYYDRSDGGITLSGGEPLIQADFCHELLQECKKSGLKSTIETCAFGKWSDLSKLIPLLDLVILDIKHTDDEKHRLATGVSNKIILDNARRIADSGVPMIVRTPVIPGFNNTPDAISNIAALIKDFPQLKYYELLPYHRYGNHKFGNIGLKSRDETMEPPSAACLEELMNAAKNQGLEAVRVGS